jgi:hypothetical protein
LAILEPKAQIIKIVDNYKAAKFSFDLDAIHLVDKMDLHRQTGEMICRDAMQASLGMKKLQNMADKIQKQLKQEKLANRTKQMRIDELENWVIELGANPKDSKSIQALIKTKDTKIYTLNKKLNIPNIDHVQTPELQEVQQEKDQLLGQMVQMKEQLNCMRNKLKF